MYEENETIIDVKGLHKYFHGIHILQGIDFKVKAGELVSIIGRSGCGKTTFLRCLNCLEIFDGGTIRIAGVTLSRKNTNIPKNTAGPKKKKFGLNGNTPFKKTENLLDEDFRVKAHTIRKRVGMLFQSFNLFPHLTVLDNVIKAPKVVKKESESQATLRALGLLEKVGMEEFGDRYPYQLSGGQAQRVAIARALAMSPQVMLYDEPTSALDPELVDEVLQVMNNLHREGMTQVVVTHAMRFAKEASDTVVYIDDGKIVESAPPDKLFTNPDEERTRQFLKIIDEI